MPGVTRASAPRKTARPPPAVTQLSGDIPYDLAREDTVKAAMESAFKEVGAVQLRKKFPQHMRAESMQVCAIIDEINTQCAQGGF